MVDYKNEGKSGKIVKNINKKLRRNFCEKIP